MSQTTLLITSTAVFDLTKFIKSMNVETIDRFANDMLDYPDLREGALETQGLTAEQIISRPGNKATLDTLPYDAFCEPDAYVELDDEAFTKALDDQYVQEFEKQFDTLEEVADFAKKVEEHHAFLSEKLKGDEEHLKQSEEGYVLAQRVLALATERLTPKC